jgi:hypothetical protein
MTWGRLMAEDWSWLTTGVFFEFAADRKIDLTCSKCGNLPEDIHVNTVNDDGYVARSSMYESRADGQVDMGKSRHVPCARTMCPRCGHVELYAMFAIDKWRKEREAGAG